MSLCPIDEPFKSPVPFNNNLGPFWFECHTFYVIVLHYNHHYLIEI